MTDISFGVRAARIWRVSERTVIGTLSVLAGIIAWELTARSGSVSPLLLSSPSSVVTAFVDLVRSGELQQNLLITGYEFFVGLCLAILIGLPLAILSGWYVRLGWLIQPLVSALYAAPTIALFPLIVLFLGIGFWDKVLLVFISGFLQIFIVTSAGISATDRKWVRLAKSFGASQPKLFSSVILPGAIPYILLGLRLAVGRCVVNVVVAEMLASKAGVGYMIAYYGNTFKIADVFVALVSVVTVGVVLNQMLLFVEHRCARWQQ
jgi:NitT/TauT family transport system permease protein